MGKEQGKEGTAESESEPPVSHSLRGLLRKQWVKQRVGMEPGRGGMHCTYAGKGGLKWLEISRDRFRAGLAKKQNKSKWGLESLFPFEGFQLKGY